MAERGDILVAFLDGTIEPENSYDEEFGQDRLSEILCRTADRPTTRPRKLPVR